VMDEVEQGIYHTGPKLISVTGEASATHATLRCLGTSYSIPYLG